MIAVRRSAGISPYGHRELVEPSGRPNCSATCRGQSGASCQTMGGFPIRCRGYPPGIFSARSRIRPRFCTRNEAAGPVSSCKTCTSTFLGSVQRYCLEPCSCKSPSLRKFCLSFLHGGLVRLNQTAVCLSKTHSVIADRLFFGNRT